MSKDFAIFILTHGRPDKQITYNMLKTSGYTGDVFLVVDNLDKTLPQYLENYGDSVIVFDKMEYVSKTDTGLTEPLINFAVFARNAIEDIAKEKGYKFFGMYDDDIYRCRFRVVEGTQIKSYEAKNLDEIYASVVEFMENGDVACTCFGTSSQFIGGYTRWSKRPLNTNELRLCFNSYIRNAKFDVNWRLNMCEDRITSIECNKLGQVWYQLLFVQIDTAPFYGLQEGGNSDVYRSLDNFTQIFFPVVTCPDTNVVGSYKDILGPEIFRKDSLCPKIISERYKL